VGTDLFSQFLKQELERTDLDVHIGVVEGSNTKNVVVVQPTGERTIFSDMGVHVTLSEDQLDIDSIRTAQYLYIPAFPAYWPLIDRFSELGPLIASDFGFVDTLAELRDYAARIGPQVDIAFLSGARLDSAIIESMETEFLNAGCEVVFVTLGRRGVRFATPDRRVHQPAFAVRVVDTNGAGDSFAAGVLVGLLEGRNLEECAQLGQAAAAARSALLAEVPTRDVVLAFLMQQ